MFRKKQFLVFIFCCLAIAIVFLAWLWVAPAIRAGALQNVFGFAWSANIGWISLNSSNCDSDNNGLSDGSPAGCPVVGRPISSYGVNIEADGSFTGYGWSANIGWVHFAPVGPYPALPNYSAKLDSETGQITGWARALSYADGWDGWIRLDGVSMDAQTKEISGYAWGSDVIGWLKFFSVYDSLLDGEPNNPPTVAGLSVNQGDYCSSPLRPILSWVFQDDPGDYQDYYNVQLDDDLNIAENPLVDSCLPAPGTCSPGHTARSFSPLSPLSYNTTYYWRVRAWDSGGLDSAWSAPDSFTTALHAFPDPDFAPISQKITEGELIRLCSVQETGICETGLSKCYNNQGDIISCWGKIFSWQIPVGAEFGEGSGANTPNPKVKFANSGLQNVSLTITDSVGACSITKQVRIARPLPDWREIAP